MEDVIAVKHATHRSVSDWLGAYPALVDEELAAFHTNHDFLEVEVGHLLEPFVEDLLTIFTTFPLLFESVICPLYPLHLGEHLLLRRHLFAFFTLSATADLELRLTLIILELAWDLTAIHVC